MPWRALRVPAACFLPAFQGAGAMERSVAKDGQSIDASHKE